MKGTLRLLVPDVNVVYRHDGLNVLMDVENEISENGAIPVLYFSKHVVDTAFITAAKAGIQKAQLLRQFGYLMDHSAMQDLYANEMFTKLSRSLAGHYIKTFSEGKLNSIPKNEWPEFLQKNQDSCPVNMWYDREDAVATTTAILESNEFFNSAPVTFVTGEREIWENVVPSSELRKKFEVKVVSSR